MPVTRRWDHPRVCGEHWSWPGVSSPVPGSSPRVRGTRHADMTAFDVGGIIPACAGNTCGMTCIRATVLGSSPRVRGTRSIPRRSWYISGIIPACAGNTAHRRRSERKTRDHPRVCGEHSVLVVEKVFRWGSSPRVRGTRQAGERGRRVAGIIPACAGNTLPRRGVVAAGWDHPRVCGEHNQGKHIMNQGTGSSPRVRGTRDEAGNVHRALGIIPACAGNT